MFFQKKATSSECIYNKLSFYFLFLALISEIVARMQKRLLTILQYLFFLALGIFLVWWSARNIDEQGWMDIRNSLKDARYWLMIPVTIVLILSHWLRALRWRIMMEPLGYQPKKSNTYFAVMIGYLANLAVPRLGEVLKCTLLARYEKIPAEKLVGTMIAERAVDVICLVIVFALAIILQTDIIGEYTHRLFMRRVGNGEDISWYIIIIFLTAIIAFLIATWYILKKFSHITIIHNLKKILKGVWQGLISIRYIKHKRLFFIYSTAIWLMYYAASYIGFYALAETSHYGFKEALSVLAFGSIGMIMTQGGIGAYQILVQKTMLLYGLNANIGWAFGWILWVAQTFVILLFGLISFVLMPWFNKKK